MIIALVTLIPVLASILSFVRCFPPHEHELKCGQVTYALSGHDLNVAIIFSSLQFFNVSRRLSL